MSEEKVYSHRDDDAGAVLLTLPVVLTLTPACGRAITILLTPRAQTGAPDRDSYLALLGALGGLVALALASTTDGG